MTRTLKLLPSLALILTVSGCQESDSILLVNLNCEPAATPSSSIQVTLSEPAHLDDTKTFPSKTNGTPLQFPTSLVLMIPRSHSGLLDLAFLALDADDATTAHATAQTTLSAGSQTTLSVTLARGNNLCGNGIMDPGEGCDDGNLYSFDGCDFNCQPEPPASQPQPDAGSRDTGSIDSSPPQDAHNLPDSSLQDLLPPDTFIPDAQPLDLLASTSPDLSPDLGSPSPDTSPQPDQKPYATDLPPSPDTLPQDKDQQPDLSPLGTPCSNNSQCTSDFCDLWAIKIACSTKLALGIPCSVDVECESKHCTEFKCGQ